MSPPQNNNVLHDGDHFFRVALTLENAFANASHLSYDAVKRSNQRSSPVDVDAVAKEKAARERERRREASEKAKRKMREEHARIERDIEKRLERKGDGTSGTVDAPSFSPAGSEDARESATKIHRREEKEGTEAPPPISLLNALRRQNKAIAQ